MARAAPFMHPDYQLPEGATLEDSSGTRLGCFAPTQAVFGHMGSKFEWNSRYHRKGRYPELRSTLHKKGRHQPPRLLPIWFGYPFLDISYWVAFVFTLGCVAWVVNGHYALWNFDNGAAAATGEDAAAKTAATAALIGGTMFEIGSWLLYWEALNPETTISTGVLLQLAKAAGSITAAAGAVAGSVTAAAGAVAGSVTAAAGAVAAAVKGRRSKGADQDHRSPEWRWFHSPRFDSDPDLRSDRQDSEVIYDPSSGQTYVLCPVANQRMRLLQAMKQQQQHGQKPATAAAVGSSKWQSNGADVEAPGIVTFDSAKSAAAAAAAAGGANGKAAAAHSNHDQQQQEQQWHWFGYRFYDIGFTASFLQLIGATIFWVPCIFGAPNVYPKEDSSNYGPWNGAYWLLQVIGATFFILSSILFMLEVQPVWYKPKPLMIGWHVGFWNFIGAAGFWLSGLFGMWEVHGKYQLGGTVMSTFWGSYAFLIGSYLQLVEAINKHPDSLPF